MILETEDDQSMVIAAHRYCLGRQTYMVGLCVEWLRKTWPQIGVRERSIILRDTNEALSSNRAGHPTIDAPLWQEFALWAQVQPIEGDDAAR